MDRQIRARRDEVSSVDLIRRVVVLASGEHAPITDMFDAVRAPTSVARLAHWIVARLANDRWLATSTMDEERDAALETETSIKSNH
jgi:hypothetical protein